MVRRMVAIILLLSGSILFTAGVSFAETVAERFDKAMKKLAEECAKHPPKPGNTDCDPLKLKPADPLTTEEGRFAHSIKIPNPVPEDSGYKPGMTPEQYFDHLCKTEAGEFIFKTVENVEGIFQMRPRPLATDYELQHLYALEDPYGTYGSENNLQESYINPSSSDYVKQKSEKGYVLYKQIPHYQFLEKLILPHSPVRTDSFKYFRYRRPDTDKLIFEDGQYFYPRNEQPKMIEEQTKELKSRYGFTWRGIKRQHDRELGIVGGELIVLDLKTNEVLAVRRGYLMSGNIRDIAGGIWWLGAQACPLRPVWAKREFIQKVLRPSKESKRS